MKPDNTAREQSPEETPEILSGVMEKVTETPDEATLKAIRKKSVADLQEKMGLTQNPGAMLENIVSPETDDTEIELPEAIEVPPEIREQDAA